MRKDFPYEKGQFLIITDLSVFRKRVFKRLAKSRPIDVKSDIRYIQISENRAYFISDVCKTCNQIWIDIEGENTLLYISDINEISYIQNVESVDEVHSSEIKLMNDLYDIAISTDRATFVRMLGIIKTALIPQNTL